MTTMTSVTTAIGLRTKRLAHFTKWLQEKIQPHQKAARVLTASALVCLLYAVIQLTDSKAQSSSTVTSGVTQPSRVLGNSVDSVNRGKEKRLERYSKELSLALTDIRETMTKLDGRITALEGGSPRAATQAPNQAPQVADGSVTLPDANNAQQGQFMTALPQSAAGTMPHLPPVSLAAPSKGDSVLSFPAQGNAAPEKAEVVLPVGSYVKAKLLTGVEAPEGRTYPVLLQLDYAHILPNKKSLDLKGCFVIAKAEGDLSTERVQMQATKLSCVARNGRMFEREINGFVADAKDNSFSVTGSVNTKQDRVAAMAFLAAVVDGIGRSVQLAQTSTQTYPSGGQGQIVTGNQGRYLAAGGAASAAGQVTQWYLKEAQNLLPTINVGSGQDVWIVLNETVALPHNYFHVSNEGGSNGKDFQFTNRLLD